MSYQDRIDAAIAVIKEHNEAIGGANSPGYVDADGFISCIKATGGTSEDRLSSLSHEDILDCLPAVKSPGGQNVKPRILAKAIANVFRANVNKQDDKRPVSSKKAERMTPRELVESFDPEDYDNSVGKRLAEIAKGERFIVYSSGRTVNIDETLKILMEIKQGYGGRDNVDISGVGPVKVYKIGELPENYAEENPLYRNRPLRPDGTCDQTGRSWEGVDLAVRQFVRVAMDTGELKVTLETAHNILDIVVGDNTMTKLRQRYRQAAVTYNDLAKTGNLPKLKIALGEGGSEGKNPFASGKRVEWTANTQHGAVILHDGRRWVTRKW